MNRIPAAQMNNAALLAEVHDLMRTSVTIGRGIIENGRNLVALSAQLRSAPLVKQGFPIEVKRVPGSPNRISGYASVFNVVDHGKDIILPGSFTETLAKHRRDGTKIVMLWSHNMDEPIGVWDEIIEDSKGLYVEGRLLPNVRRGSEAIELIAAGATGSLSIGYRVLESDNTAAGIRRISKIQLFEISVVSVPMNPHAKLGEAKEYEGGEVQLALAKLRRAADNFKIPRL